MLVKFFESTDSFKYYKQIVSIPLLEEKLYKACLVGFIERNYSANICILLHENFETDIKK